MLQQFGLIKPDHLEDDTRLLKRFDNPLDEGDEIFFYQKGSYIIIYSECWVTRKLSGERRFLADQLEIPAAGIPWFIDTLENKFFKHSSKGGLPPGTIHYKEVVDGETLFINRGFAIGGEGIGGYTLTNLDRLGYISLTAKQDFAMPDPFLFKHGLFDYLKELADQIRRGEV